jgi:tRNA dimethylallyltransferase
VIVVCGPTASGKSALADEIAGGMQATTIVVDSMQVYREIPLISNQKRMRPAELVGAVSVTEEWTVARHRAFVDALLAGQNAAGPRFVLDAGTGMYLNAVLMDIDLAPRVEASVRAEAVRQTTSALTDDVNLPPTAANARREVRRRELELAGAPARGSIWRPKMRLGADILYLRPPRDRTDAAIDARSASIASGGLGEARILMELAANGEPPTAQVMESIGVRELVALLESADTGAGAVEDAERQISTRTRRLARRQVRWFDKMVRTLKESASITVADGPEDPRARAFVERSIRSIAQHPHGRMD